MKHNMNDVSDSLLVNDAPCLCQEKDTHRLHAPTSTFLLFLLD